MNPKQNPKYIEENKKFVSEKLNEFDKAVFKSERGYHLVLPEMLGVEPSIDHFVNYFKIFLKDSLSQALEYGFTQRKEEGYKDGYVRGALNKDVTIN